MSSKDYYVQCAQQKILIAKAISKMGSSNSALEV